MHVFVAILLLTSAMAGCGRTPSSYIGQIRAHCPDGWQASASNNSTVLRRKADVWVMGKVSNPPPDPKESEAAYFQRWGHQIHYELRLRFVPLLSPPELEKLLAARQQAAARLAHCASKSEYDRLRIEYENCQIPTLFTKDQSIYVERWADIDETNSYRLEPGFIAVYPPEAALEIEALVNSLGKVFNEYEPATNKLTGKVHSKP